MCIRLSPNGWSVSGCRIAAIVVLAIMALWIAPGIAPISVAAQEGPCAARPFDDARFTVCTIDPATHDVVLYSTDEEGRAYGGFARIPQERDGAPLVFAMNAGMYRADLSPVGLHVEEGEEIRAINTRPGPGNFHMLPNGVFYMTGDRAGVATAEDFLARGITPDLATQSGPMLVIDGVLHPRFLEDSTSALLRNGVGVDAGGERVIFAISDQPVTFHRFARLFRDHLGLPQALYFDGNVSRLHAPGIGRSDWGRPMGPVVGMVRTLEGAGEEGSGN